MHRSFPFNPARACRIGIAGLTLFLSACGNGPDQAAPPPLPVEVMTVQEGVVPNIIELPGRVEPVRVAEVRARVTGILERRLYEEGTDVGQGQALFRIDPREARAGHAQATAALARARATAANARAVVARYRPLVTENAISQQEFDAAIAAEREANANVAQLQAQVEAVGLQLGYTTVRAPIAGRASRTTVTEGALVSAAEGTLLTRIEQLDPIHVTFAQSSRRLMEIRRGFADGSIALDAGEPTEVRLFFEDGAPYSVPGRVNFLDYSVDEHTGTVTLRAIFSNPQRLLLPGEFVRAQVVAGYRQGGVMVSQRAVLLSEDGGSVYVVNDKGQAELRPVELGQMVDGQWLIESGLKTGDRVILTNLQKLRPGAPVEVVKPAADKADAGKADTGKSGAGKSGTTKANAGKAATTTQSVGK